MEQSKSYPLEEQMTSVEKLTHIKNGKKVSSHLVHLPHYEVQGEIGMNLFKSGLMISSSSSSSTS